MPKIVKCQVMGIEEKTVTKAGEWNGRPYFVISFLDSTDLLFARPRKTVINMVGNPAIDKPRVDFLRAAIQSKNYPEISGSTFVVGDKSLDPNTITLPLYRSVKEDGTLGIPQNTMEVFCLYSEAAGKYIEQPQKKALSIIYNPELCSVVHTENPGDIEEIDPLGVGTGRQAQQQSQQPVTPPASPSYP